MKESITIKNFGPIKDITIEEVKPLTVLIGESGSGKSTVMKALSLFRWIYKMQNIRSYLKHSGIKKSTFSYTMPTYIKNSGFEQFVSDKAEIHYTYGSDSSGYHKIEYKNRHLDVSGNIDLNLLASKTAKQKIQYA